MYVVEYRISTYIFFILIKKTVKFVKLAKYVEYQSERVTQHWRHFPHWSNQVMLVKN